jgi:signal transduction histidine kinase
VEGASVFRRTTDHGEDERPGLVLRFAVASLVAFLIVGAVVGMLAVRQVRGRAEEVADFHARFIASAVLGPILRETDLTRPVTGEPLERVDAIMHSQVLTDGRDVRVKVWRPDGTVVYSDEPDLIGRRFPEEASELEEVMAGETVSGVTDLEADENVFERSLAQRLYQTYVPILDEEGHPIAVAEVYQRYAVIQEDVSRLVRTLAVVFVAGLLLLYGALLPIAVRASRTLRARNVRLREQAAQLEVLLAREQETVVELRRLGRMKDDLVAAASHELRSPLTAIIGSLRTLERPDVQEDPRVRGELVAAARLQAERLFRLVRNLLRGAHLQDGDGAVSSEEVDPAQVIANAVRDLPDAATRVRVDAASLPAVRTDPQRLEEIVANLVENALKFSPPDAPVKVDVRVDRSTLVIEVRDHGIGISPEEVDVIFERFHQADQSATRRFGGLGLGLYLVREMTAELQGTVSVAPADGGGSIFSVSIPVGRSAVTLGSWPARNAGGPAATSDTRSAS